MINRKGVVGIDDKEEKLVKLVNAASDAIKENGKTYEFICPLCGNKAYCEKASVNDHLHASCKYCKTGFSM